MIFEQKLHTFPSGLRLVYTKMPGYYTAKFKLMVEVGAEDEKAPNGVAHLLEHSVFKGTDKFSQEEISEKFDSLSADVNASTSSEFTVYKATFPKRNLVKVVGLLSHILKDSVFDPTLLEKEKHVVIEEILMHEDNPDQLAFDNLTKIMYGDVGIGNDIAGEIQNVEKIKSKDLKSFHKAHYSASNFLVSVMGDFEESEIIDLIKAEFEEKFTNPKAIKKNWSKKSKTKPQIKVEQKDINQSNIMIGFRTLPYEDLDRIKFNIISFILGGSMSSRLFKKIRNDMGLCYSVYAFELNYKNNGFLGVSLATTKANESRAIKEVNNEIEKILNSGVTDSEFNVAKNLTLDKYLMGNDTPQVGLSYLSYTNKLFDQEKVIEYIRSIKKEDCLAVFRKLVKIEEEFVSIVSPKSCN